MMYTQTIGFSIVAYSSTVSEIGVSFSDSRSDVILAILIVETNEITEMIVIAIRAGINHIVIGKTPFFALVCINTAPHYAMNFNKANGHFTTLTT